MIKCFGVAGLVLMAFLMARPAQAAPFTLSAADLNQLRTWLGSGPITLTDIFDKTAGDCKTGTDFHTAADGKDATFAVFLASAGTGNQLIGGYDPLSWDSSGNWHYAATDADRSAFLFNL
jgi:hypothetical protein